MRLRNGAGLRLQCLEGIAWITFHGEAEDLMLHAGQAAVVPNDRLVLMEAVGCGRLRIVLGRELAKSRAGHAAQAVMLRLHGLSSRLSPRLASRLAIRFSLRRALPD